MFSLANLKTEATALKAHALACGRSLKHSTALEQVAKRHGFENWRACVATLTHIETTARPLQAEREMADVTMKHYRNMEWDFSLDIPNRWNMFPPVPSESPNEVIRFASHEKGIHYCVVSRAPRDPEQPSSAIVEVIKKFLTKKGFSNFAISETKLESGSGLKLDGDRPEENEVFKLRGYIIFHETLVHMLAFLTNRLDDANIDLFERMAQSFSFPSNIKATSN